MSSILRLYRGDSSEIEEFHFRKTKRTCLYGQGIYLTDDEPMAHTYRIKGAKHPGYSSLLNTDPYVHAVLFDAHAPNKEVALEQALVRFCAYRSAQDAGLRDFHLVLSHIRDWIRKPSPTLEKLVKKYRHEWLVLLDLPQGKLAVTRRNTLTPSGSSRPSFEVVWNPVPHGRTPKLPKVGRVTVFEFDKLYMERNTIHVDTARVDKTVWQILYDLGFRDSYEPNLTVDQIAYQYQYWSLEDALINGSALAYERGLARSLTHPEYSKHSRAAIWNYLRRPLSDYGIIGYRHYGGVHLGGKRHNVYIIWDEDLVNQHKVGVIE